MTVEAMTARQLLTNFLAAGDPTGRRRLQIDINELTPDGLTPASFHGSCPEVGERVIVFEPEDHVRAHAVVETVALHRQLVFLRVDWDSMCDDE